MCQELRRAFFFFPFKVIHIIFLLAILGQLSCEESDNLPLNIPTSNIFA